MQVAMGKHVNTILAHYMIDMLLVCIYHTDASQRHANSLKFSFNFKCHMELKITCTCVNLVTLLFLTWATNIVKWHNI
jgi:hypothetical protein